MIIKEKEIKNCEGLYKIEYALYCNEYNIPAIDILNVYNIQGTFFENKNEDFVLENEYEIEKLCWKHIKATAEYMLEIPF